MFGAIALSLTIAAATPMSPSDRAAAATKLAQILANSRGYTTAKVYVGEMPQGVSIAAPLPKFTLLGSVVTSPRIDSENAVPTAEVYYEVPSDGALATYRRQLEAAGWKASRFMQRFSEFTNPAGGFAVTRPKPDVPDVYCRAATMVALMRIQSMPNVVAVAFGGGAEVNTICKMSAVMSAMPTPAPPPTLPTLQAPPNVTMESQSFGGFGGRVSGALGAESDAFLTSSEPLPQIGAAFAQQLSAAGWAADAAAQSGTAYAQTFHMTSKGHRLHAVLSLFATGKEHQYDAVLRAVDLDAAPAPSTGFSFPFFR